MAVFAVVTILMDNFIRPVLIRKGAPLPLLLILAGVLGGLLVAGLLGIFIGPTVLAVAYTLLMAWIESDDTAPPSTWKAVALPLPSVSAQALRLPSWKMVPPSAATVAGSLSRERRQGRTRYRHCDSGLIL